jgi:hypothetical protein
VGTWGAQRFDNDDALDWLAELETDGEAAIRAALEPVAGAESERRELWDDAGDPEWAQAVRDLRLRLGDTAPRS